MSGSHYLNLTKRIGFAACEKNFGIRSMISPVGENCAINRGLYSIVAICLPLFLG